MPGSVYAWGYSEDGAFGDGSTGQHATPVQTNNVGTGIKGISAGRHSMALGVDGKVFAWGSNGLGQLGNGGTGDQYTPVQVQLANAVGPLRNIKAISTGKHTGGPTHSLALTVSGKLWAWGSNFLGELGIGSSDNNPHPHPVQVPGLTGIVQVAGGHLCTFAVHVNGTVSAWGHNGEGQLGDNSQNSHSTPALVKDPGGNNPLTGIESVSACAHVLALSWDGTVYGWGRNGEGQLGIGNNNGQIKLPVQVGQLSNIVAVAAGSRHSLALHSDGTVFAWGENTEGRLGNGSKLSSNTPVQVKAPAGDPEGPYLTRVIAIAAGYYNSCALRADGTVYTWGSGLALGNGNPNESTIPVQVSNLAGITAVHMGAFYGLALT